MHRTIRRRITAALASTALAGTAGVGLLAAPAAAAPITETFDEAGEHSFTVPPDVCEITVDAYGAQGGGIHLPGTSYPGGLGGRARTTLAVTPGEILLAVVGGEGGYPGPGGGPGGFNGGGAGGDGHTTRGGGGGGASDVRRAPWGLTDRLVVAGGGGGGAGNEFEGGSGGGTVGDPGDGWFPGGGGTQSAGGPAGSGQDPGTPGTLGFGGTGGTAVGDPSVGGGGGGAGFFGGGGGGGYPFWRVAGSGGGGSGFTPDGAGMETGVHEGDGLVTITYDPDAGTCPHHQPDAHVQVAGGAPVGDDVYTADGTGQTVSAFALRLFTSTSTVTVENDGNRDDAFTLAGTGNTPGFAVRYVDGGVDVTGDVVAGTHTTPTLAPGEAHTLTVQVTVGLLAPLLGSHTATVTAASTNDPSAIDAVRAITTTL